MAPAHRPRNALKKTAEAPRGRPGAAAFFFDEGRFGPQPSVGGRRAKKGGRPIAAVNTGYKNFYAYSAACPSTGEHAGLPLPWADAEMTNIFLGSLGNSLNGRRCALILDQAGWHKPKGLHVPPNIELVYLPPRSPELNPVGRLWGWLKRECVRNRFHQTLDGIMDAPEDCLRRATADFLMGLCGCSYFDTLEMGNGIMSALNSWQIHHSQETILSMALFQNFKTKTINRCFSIRFCL